MTSVLKDTRPKTLSLEQDIASLNLDREAELILADAWGPGTMNIDYLLAQSATEIEVGPWLPDTSADDRSLVRVGFRLVGCRIPVRKMPFCPASTRMTVLYRISVEGSGKEGCGVASVC